jgi:hypothetical protein
MARLRFAAQWQTDFVILKVQVLLLLAALWAAGLPAQAPQYVPALDGLTDTGCEIYGYATGEYHVDVWADYADGRKQGAAKHGWVRLYSIRSESSVKKNRNRAFADCDEWMGKIDKLRKAKAAAEAESHNGKPKPDAGRGQPI